MPKANNGKPFSHGWHQGGIRDCRRRPRPERQ
jgi:hypothetical protein